MEKIEKAQVMKMKSLTDLLRLIVSRMDPRGQSGFLYYGKVNDKHYYFNTQVVPGWYNLRGLPVVMSAEFDEAPKTNIIQYKPASDMDPEKWEFVDYVQTGPKTAFIPIVNLDSIPEFLL